MQHRLRTLLYSLFFFGGVSLFTSGGAYAQATVVIDNVKNPCGTASDGSFEIVVTAGTPLPTSPPDFMAVVLNTSTAETAFVPLTMGVPQIVSGLSPGSIYVLVNDGDPANNFDVFINFTAIPQITGITTTNANNTEGTCSSPNGSITINTINGGSGNFSFSWTGPNGFTASTQNIAGLAGGDYVVTITDDDANCSFVSGTFTLTDPVPNAFTISTTDATPCSNTAFAVDLSIGEVGVEYELYVDGNPTGITVVGPSTTLAHPGLTSGPHAITVLASMGACTPIFSSNSLNIAVEAGPTSAVLGGDAAICAGGSTDLSVIITGGSGPYTLTIDNGVGTLNNYVSGTPIPVSPASTTVYNIVGNVIDANGCEVAGSGSATVTAEPAPTAAVSGGGGFCIGDTGPTVTLTFTGATPFDFTYTDGTTPVSVTGHNALTYNIPGAGVGTYSVTALTDNNGCPGTLLGTPVVVTQNALPTANATGGGTVCAGDVLPGVEFVFTGTGPFDFEYSDGTTVQSVIGHNNTTYTIANAPAGTYSVTSLTDANGCAATNFGATAAVVVNPLPTATITGGGSYCEGSASPTVTFTFTGTAPFNFTYTDGTSPVVVNNHPSTTFEINGAAVGAYSVTALADANGCVATALGTPVDVVENPRPTAAVSGGGTLCAGSTLPDVTFTFTGTAPYDFTYTDGTGSTVITGHPTNTFTVANAAAGSYSVTALTDVNGCAGTNLGGAANVIVDPLPTASLSGGGAVCLGDALPNVTFTFTGAAPYDFTYSNGVTSVTINNHNFATFTITNAVAGTYSITALTDDKGCVATDLGTPVVVTQNPRPTAVVGGGGIVCQGDVLPDITFTFTGTAPFNFTYSNGATPVTINNHNSNDFTIANALAGTYSVTALSDANGCVATSLGGSAAVVVNNLPSATISGGGEVCAGGVLPSITFTFTGAVPFDFTYTDGTNTFNIDDNSTTFTITNAAPGTYAITALSDNNGCVATDLGTPVNVVEHALPTAVASGGGTVCEGTDLPDVTFTFTGTAPYDFTYTDGTTSFNITNHNTATFVVADAPAGAYAVTALTDANGCVATSLGTTVDVQENTLPTATLSGGGVYCEGSPEPDVTFTFTGALPFEFTYTDGVAPVTISGHNSLTFTLPNAAAGVYTITALTDANGCAATDLGTPVSVTENPLPTAAVSGGGPVCEDAALPDVTFTFTGTAPFDFTYTDGTTPVVITGHGTTTFTIPGAAAGSYSVTSLTDANGCVATTLGGQADVIVNTLPTAAVAGGGSYCEGSPAPSVTFTFTGSLPLDFTYTDGTTPVTVTGHNLLTYVINNATTGTYSVTSLTDANACAATDLGSPVAVTEETLPTADVNGGGTVCSDDELPGVTFTFTGTAPFDFTYTDGTTPVVVTGHTTNTFTIPNAAAGTYSVTALNDNGGCVAVDLGGSVAVVVEPAATAEAGNPQMICGGGTATLVGSSIGGSATTGAWSIVSQPSGGDGALSDVSQTGTPSLVTFTATVEGTYTLRLTTEDPGGLCEAATDEVVITVSTGATAEAGPVQTICESSVAQLAGDFTGSTGITWTTSGDGVFDDASLPNAQYTPGPNDKTNGSVTLTITTSGPCAPVSDNVVITITPDPIIDAGAPQTICSSASVVLNASFGGSATGLLWSTSGDGTFDDITDPDATYTPGVNDAASGSVTLTATATGNCAGFSDNVVITVNPAAVVDAGLPQSVCIGNLIILNGTMSGAATSLTWTTAGDGTFSDATDPNATYTPGPNDLTNGSVTLTATTNNPAGPCPAASDQVVMTFIALPGDQTTAGSETWIGYVYDDSGDPAPYPAKVDFGTTKYRGFIDSDDIAGMSPQSSYDIATDVFDLDLGVGLLQGPNVCGSYDDNFSIRYKMNKTFDEGVYRFTAGSDDGVRLLIDGVDVIAGAFIDQSYTTYTSLPICLSGVHLIEIYHYENAGLSRLSFSYEPVPGVTTDGPLQVCVNSPAPTLTASSTDPDVVDFNWYRSGTLVFTGASYTPDAADLDMTVSGTTTFTARAVYACGESAGSDVVVDVLNTATLVVDPQTICQSGGLVDLTNFVDAVPPGGTFVFSGHANISGNQFDPTGLAGTTVSIAVDYSTGSCTATQATLNLTVTDLADITVPPTASVVCESSPAIDLTALVSGNPAGGAFVFAGTQVTGNMFDPSGLSGVQTITVDYSIGGCAAPQMTFDIDVTTTATIITNNTATCENGSGVNLLALVTATPPGGTFTFSGPGVSGSLFNPAGQSGTVTIPVTYDVNGCATANGAIQVTVRAASDPLCLTGNCATVEIVPLVEPATCTNSDGRMVMSITPFTPVINNTGVKITIDGISSTGLNITRTLFNANVFDNLPVGNYNYVIEYGDPSCIKTGIFSIDQSGTVGPAHASNIVNPVCHGTPTGSLIVDIPGETGNVLEWSLDGGLTDPFKPFTAGGVITGIPAGPSPTFQQVLSIRRNASDVCYSSVAFVMTESTSAIEATFDLTPATCNGNDGAISNIVPSGGNGGPYMFSIDGGLTFQPGNSFDGLAGNSYTLLVRDGAGCEREFPATVTFPGMISYTTSKTDANCTNGGESGAITVVVTDAGVFQVALSTDQFNTPPDSEFMPYSSPGINFDQLPKGQYFVYLKSASTVCPTRSAPINILGIHPITFDLVPNCVNNEVSLLLDNVTGEAVGAPLELQISRRFSTDPPEIIYRQFPDDGEIFLDYATHTFLQTPGEYSVRIIQFQFDVVCNVQSQSFDFTIAAPLSAQVGNVQQSYPDIPTGDLQIRNFSGGVYPYEVRIELDSASSVMLPFYSTTFEPAGMNSNQDIEKIYSDIPAGRYLVEVRDALGCAVDLVARVPLDQALFIPNIFTPNGDNSNDVFFIRNLPTEGGENKLVITNRWGKKVYSSDNYQNNWDGGDAADGIYFYRLQLAGGEAVTGWVEILRGPKP